MYALYGPGLGVDGMDDSGLTTPHVPALQPGVMWPICSEIRGQTAKQSAKNHSQFAGQEFWHVAAYARHNVDTAIEIGGRA